MKKKRPYDFFSSLLVDKAASRGQLPARVPEGPPGRCASSFRTTPRHRPPASNPGLSRQLGEVTTPWTVRQTGAPTHPRIPAKSPAPAEKCQRGAWSDGKSHRISRKISFLT